VARGGESPDKDVARESLELLGLFYEPFDGRNHPPHEPYTRANNPPLPKSVEEWRTWAKETGSKLTPSELLGNFDNHFQ